MAAFDAEDEPARGGEVDAVLMARERYDQQPSGIFGLPEEVGLVSDLQAPGPAGPVGLRLYTPAGERPRSPRPVVLFAHGGGWIEGSLTSHDGLCRALCNGTRALVVAVNYRLAPEHPFPAGLQDCMAAHDWLIGAALEMGGDPQRMAVVGESAGANLMAVVCRLARDRGHARACLQVLAYPALDPAMASGSYRELAEDYGLTHGAMERCWRLYLGDHDPEDPDAAPLNGCELSGLPPALVLTCEYDPLREEGEAYGERLRSAGVSVRTVRWPGMAHGFLRWRGAVDAATPALDDVCRELRRALDVPADA